MALYRPERQIEQAFTIGSTTGGDECGGSLPAGDGKVFRVGTFKETSDLSVTSTPPPLTAVGLTDCFTVSYEPVRPNTYCESILSGNWSSPSTWSCGHEPSLTDTVVLNPGHTVIVSTDSARAKRLIYSGGTLKFTSPTGHLLLSGNEDVIPPKPATDYFIKVTAGEVEYAFDGNKYGYYTTPEYFMFGADNDDFSQQLVFYTTKGLTGKPESIPIMTGYFARSRTDSYETISGSVNGMLTVTKIDDKILEGTFYFDVYRGTTKLTLKNGSFRVHFSR